VNHFGISLAVAAGSVLLLAACGEAPADSISGPALSGNQIEANSQSTVQTWVEDMTGVTYQIDCGPSFQTEGVVLQGQIVYRFNVVVDGRGGVHISSGARPVGLRGVGLETGQQYRVSEHSHESWLTAPTVTMGSYRSTLTMVGVESKQRFTVVHSGLFVLNAEGELTVARGDDQVECR
jgi:hypothetical protein